MQYMDMVINETQRLYPAISRIDRECTKEYKVPGTQYVIECGTPIVINIVGLHCDPEYFTDPERFDPERFSKEEISKRHPYVFLPFGAGPRNCIGMRFALLEVKAIVAKMLSNVRFQTCEKTEIPMKILNSYPMSKPKNAVWLKVENL